MALQFLKLFNFKNHLKTELYFKHKIACFSGKNGAGKSNILDAIFLLVFGKSFYGLTDQELITYGEEFYRIEANWKFGEVYEQCVKFKPNGKKQMLWDNQVSRRLSEHFGRIPLVMIAPEDEWLIMGGSEQRRKFMDVLLMMVSGSYRIKLGEYLKVLKQRNQYLKGLKGNQVDKSLISVYDDQLIPLAEEISSFRSDLVNDLLPFLNLYYAYFEQGDMEDIQIDFVSQLMESDFDTRLRANLNRDIIMTRTELGAHRDDIQFRFNHALLKRIASQGQKKSFLFALKFAAFSYVKDKTGKSSIILIDDIFEKLDAIRARKLFNIIDELGAPQVFTSCTDHEIIKTHYEDECDIFTVENGIVT